MTRAKWIMLLTLALSLGLACVRAPYPEDVYLQHSPTLVLLVLLPLLCHRWPLSDQAIACVVGFMLLHTLGARYIYSNVPYDRWATALLGHDLTTTFGWQRNHYDRLVHFAFGLLGALPLYEVATRHLGIPRRLAYYMLIESVLAFSALYELVEWGLGMAVSPEEASDYAGHQGDIWDAHKDMSLALVGAIVSTAALLVSRAATNGGHAERLAPKIGRH